MAYDHQQIVFLLRQLLAENRQIRLQEAAQQLGIERHTIEKALKEITGSSFREFRQRVIVNEALRMLESNDCLSTKEIAVYLGYGSGTTFARFLRKQTGQTPTELRRQRWRRRIA